MRTTITIPDELLKTTLKLSGKRRLSEAVVTVLKEYAELQGRLEFLNLLFEKKVPHSKNQIKKQRKKDKWL